MKSNRLTELRSYIKNARQPLLTELEIFTILVSQSEASEIQNEFIDEAYKPNLLSLDPSSAWFDQVQLDLQTKMVVLPITQTDFSEHWSKILSWKDMYNRKLKHQVGSNDANKIINHKAFILLLVSDTENLPIEYLKKVSNSIFNFDITY